MPENTTVKTASHASCAAMTGAACAEHKRHGCRAKAWISGVARVNAAVNMRDNRSEEVLFDGCMDCLTMALCH